MYDVINMPDLVSRYFSSNLWLGAFIVSVIYLFFRLNSAGKRALFASVIAFFLVINVFVIKAFTALNENDTFYRHLWSIPSATIIGIAMVDLVRIIPRWYLRIPAIAAIAIFLYFANQEYIRCREHYFSTDAKMVTEDVRAIGNELGKQREESGKNILFVACPTGYGNQYGNFINELNLYSGFLTVLDSSFLNDENHNGEDELTGENPDVEFIMSKSCASGIDYVVLGKENNTEVTFERLGYRPELVTDSYILYRCKGYAGYKKDLNSLGQLAWKKYYDNKGNMTINNLGYCKVEYGYDNTGRKITEVYKGINDQNINNYEGYSRCDWTYGKYGIDESRYYDTEGNTCVSSRYGYCFIRYTRDKDGKILYVSYLDEKEQLVNIFVSNPYAIVLYEYDEKGDLVSKSYYTAEEGSKIVGE